VGARSDAILDAAPQGAARAAGFGQVAAPGTAAQPVGSGTGWALESAARQFAAAAAAQAGPGFGKFMGSAMGMPQETADPGYGVSQNPGAFFGSSMPNTPMQAAAQTQPPVRRREMRGPSGVDDILRTFEEVRRAEESPTMFVPPSPVPNQQPAVVAASEIQSQASEDMGSVATGKTGNRRAKRRAPVENTIMLNV